MRVKFTIKEKAIPKSRPRMNTCTGRAYTPSKTREFEEFVGYQYMKNGLTSFGDKPIQVNITFCFELPSSWSNKKKKEALEMKHIPTKCDLDNLIKSVTDGLNKIAYNDDRFIYKIVSSKIYSNENKIEIEITDETT